MLTISALDVESSEDKDSADGDDNFLTESTSSPSAAKEPYEDDLPTEVAPSPSTTRQAFNIPSFTEVPFKGFGSR
jgi:hypothetical protein